MSFVPMLPEVHAHIKANEQNATRSELCCQIEALKTGVSSSANAAWFTQQDLVGFDINDGDSLDLLILTTSNRIGRQFQSLELWHATAPPTAIANIQRIGPTTKLPTLVHSYNTRFTLKNFNSSFLSCWTRGDYSYYVSIPIWPPIRSCPSSSFRPVRADHARHSFHLY